MQTPSLNINLGRRTGGEVVGLDIQPGLLAAVQARVNGSILAEHAATMPLGPDTVREGEVADSVALSEALRELFGQSRLGKRVRVGVANQRTVLRTLDLPPVTDRKELAAAVRFQAQDQVPMPLSNAVLDFHPLGIVETPGGARQRVVLVAAQRDMIERLLAAIRDAGLNPVGVDLSAFALIRSLYRPDPQHAGRVLYLNVDGLTNLAIAEGTVCRFTRVIGGGLEAIAGELAARRGIAVAEARALLATIDLSQPEPGEPSPTGPDAAERKVTVPGAVEPSASAPEEDSFDADAPLDPGDPVDPQDHAAREAAMSYAETYPAEPGPEPQTAPEPSAEDVRTVLENGIREISGEVRNSLDFHRSQEGGGEVSHVVLSGSALDISGFAQALQASMGVEVHSEAVGLADASLATTVPTHRLAVAAGLAATEVSP
jgi:type IV pilus assembly protein PilM